MKRFLSAIPLLPVAACMAPANAPSLLPRAIETHSAAVASTSTAPEVQAPDPALAARLAALLTEVRNGDADFVAADTAGASTIFAGRSASEGSETWIAAEQNRSALQAARQRSAAALAELDSLAIAQADALVGDGAVGGLAAVEDARSAAEAIVARQSARLAELSR